MDVVCSVQLCSDFTTIPFSFTKQQSLTRIDLFSIRSFWYNSFFLCLSNIHFHSVFRPNNCQSPSPKETDMRQELVRRQLVCISFRVMIGVEDSKFESSVVCSRITYLVTRIRRREI